MPPASAIASASLMEQSASTGRNPSPPGATGPDGPASVVMVTLSGLILAGFAWRPLQTQHLLMLGASAFLLTGGFFSQLSAIRMGELSFISPFAFVGIIVALTLGYLVWGDVPTSFMLTGIGLIVASCVYIARSKTV